MLEPIVEDAQTGMEYPFSMAPLAFLLDIANPSGPVIPPTGQDIDFGRRYAAILVREQSS